MTDDEKRAQAEKIGKALKDAGVDGERVADAEGEKLDKLLVGIDSIAGMCDALGKRIDALENGSKPRPKEDVEADAEREIAIPLAADQRKIDAEHEAAMADVQARADSVAQCWGERAPPPMSGERLLAYRLRLLRRYQPHSPEFKDIDLRAIGDAKAFGAIEGRIYADAQKASLNPSAPEGRLRQITRHETGHIIHTFHGHPSAWMNQFGSARRYVTKIASPMQFREQL